MLYLVKHPYSWTLNDETKTLVFFITERNVSRILNSLSSPTFMNKSEAIGIIWKTYPT